jgi:hypothetical protein
MRARSWRSSARLWRHSRFLVFRPLLDSALDLEADYWNRNKKKNSIFLLSKQISEEALDMLYGDSVFMVYLNGESELRLQKNFHRSEHTTDAILADHCTAQRMFEHARELAR